MSVAVWASAGIAAPPPVVIPVDPDSYQSGGPTGGPFDFLYNLKRSNFLLGDMWGLRTALSKYGMSLAVQETSEEIG
ncbi:MAG TPA: hypothetical protein VMB81_12150, partial [Candidatus Sulfotelmatobacter sp.]|nr:hypothetical protein [Candidatus Sulfotelmatobacter sp.]